MRSLLVNKRKCTHRILHLRKNQTLALLGEGGQGKMRILTLLMRLRQICCHPTLFDENYDKDSGKLDLLMELVTNAVESGHRILVFFTVYVNAFNYKRA